MCGEECEASCAGESTSECCHVLFDNEGKDGVMSCAANFDANMYFVVRTFFIQYSVASSDAKQELRSNTSRTRNIVIENRHGHDTENIMGNEEA